MSIQRHHPDAEIRIETELPPLPADGKARLRRLIEFLRELEPEKFNFGVILEEKSCGTVGCAIGWMPWIFPEHVHRVDNCVSSIGMTWWDESSFTAAAKVFGISPRTSTLLFQPGYQKSLHHSLPECLGDASATRVADMLTAYLTLTETPKRPTP